MGKLINIILLIVGIFMLGHSAVLFFGWRHIHSDWKITEGTVTRLEKRWYSGGSHAPSGYAYVPFVRLLTKGGDIVEFEGHGKSPPEFQPGETVTVLYDPANPQEVMIDSEHQRFLTMWHTTWWRVGIGLMLIGANFAKSWDRINTWLRRNKYE